jgi:hypothetical protein
MVLVSAPDRDHHECFDDPFGALVVPAAPKAGLDQLVPDPISLTGPGRSAVALGPVPPL